MLLLDEQALPCYDTGYDETPDDERELYRVASDHFVAVASPETGAVRHQIEPL